MEKVYPSFTISLDSPFGKALEDNIKSSLSIRVEVNDSRGVDLRIFCDHGKALQGLGQFLKDSLDSVPGFLDGRPINSINACAPEYLFEPSTANNRFTPKENEVMALVSEGESNQEIATHINSKLETIRTHRKKAFARMNVKKRIRAIGKYRKIKGEVFIPDADVRMHLSRIGLAC